SASVSAAPRASAPPARIPALTTRKVVSRLRRRRRGNWMRAKRSGTDIGGKTGAGWSPAATLRRRAQRPLNAPVSGCGPVHARSRKRSAGSCHCTAESCTGTMCPVHGRPGARPAAPPPDAVHYTLRRIRRPALAGRIAGALSHGVHVLLTAEAGFGKSAVLEEALALLAKRAWRVRPSEAAAQLQHLVAAAPDEDVVVVVDDAEQVANDEVVALLQR